MLTVEFKVHAGLSASQDNTDFALEGALKALNHSNRQITTPAGPLSLS